MNLVALANENSILAAKVSNLEGIARGVEGVWLRRSSSRKQPSKRQ